VDEAALVEAVATAIMDSLKPKTLDRLRAAITKKIKQPQRRAVNIKSLERQLEKQTSKLLVLDADMVGPVQAEIRRLRREIEQAKRTIGTPSNANQGH
jgi:Mrp family chromosome partitioning ATPase